MENAEEKGVKDGVVVKTMQSRAKVHKISMALVEHKLWQQQVRVREMTLMATVIPDKFGPSAAGGNACAVQINIIVETSAAIAKMCCQERDAEQIERCVQIINCLWNFVDMHFIFIVYQLKADRPGITLLGSASVNCLDKKILRVKLTYKQ